jgi:gluconolactonase
MNLKKYFIRGCLISVILFGPFSFSQEFKKENDFIIDSLKFEKVVENMNFPEGPAWDGEGNLYCSSCYGGYIVKVEGDSHKIFITSTTGMNSIKNTNGLTVYKNGDIFACDYGRGAILRIQPDSQIIIYASGYNDKPFSKPNDLTFDPDGNLFFSDTKSYNKNIPDGTVYRVDFKTKEVTPAVSNICFPNGVAFSPDNKYFFLCESAQNRILRFKVQSDGSLTNKEVFVNLPGGDPDGLAFDIKGNLYAAHYGGKAIYVISPNGVILKKIPTPGKNPSNVEFGGKDMKTLFITEDETNCIYKTKVKIPGSFLFSFPVSR